MEERLAKVEKGQKDLETRLGGVSKNISDQITQSQASIIARMTDLLLKTKSKERVSMDGSDIEGHEGFASHMKDQPEVLNPEKRVYAGIYAKNAVRTTVSHHRGTSTNQPIDLGAGYEDEVKRIKAEIEEKHEERFRFFEERFKTLQGTDEQGNDASDLSLVTDLVLPPKFKVPNFEKYDGTTCPLTHITMYCRRMATFVKDEKLLIHCFQDSLTGSATHWYAQLSRADIKSWKDLSKAFIGQYKHVSDMTPNRLMLQGMEQKHSESIREYARRWRDVAAQVQPPLPEGEIIPLFVDTLKGVLYDRLISNPAKSFADMVMTGERIEDAIKKGKIVDPYSTTAHEGHESQVHMVGSRPNNQFRDRFHNQVAWSTKSPKVLHPIPMLYTNLLPVLFEKKLLTPVQSKPKDPPYPEGYDVSAVCDYHVGSMGHTTENCGALKNKVQGLIENGLLKF